MDYSSSENGPLSHIDQNQLKKVERTVKFENEGKKLSYLTSSLLLIGLS